MAKRKTKPAGRTRANGEGTIWTDPKTGTLYAVVTWTEVDEDGKPRRRRRAKSVVNRTDGKEEIKKLREQVDRELRARGEVAPTDARIVNPSRLTWQQLGAWFQTHYLGEPRFNSERKLIAGCLSWKQSRRQLRTLVQRFGPTKLVRDLTTEDLKAFKEQRMLEPVVTMKYARDPISNRILTDEAGNKLEMIAAVRERAVASPHRELAMIRQLLNHAHAKGWIPHNPWHKGLIKPGEETKRDTIATQVEETTLLELAQDDKKRRHLWLYLTVMFDTACRSAELRRLLVRDVDFNTDQFQVFSFKGKLRRERMIPMTPRARLALLDACAGKSPDDFVFTYDVRKKHEDGTTSIEHRPLKSAPKTSWKTARRLAKWWSDDQVNLDKFRGHDIRHTTITRLVNSNEIPEANIMKVTGHTQMATFLRYVNPDHTERSKVANVLANYSEAPVVNIASAKRKRKNSA